MPGVVTNARTYNFPLSSCFWRGEYILPEKLRSPIAEGKSDMKDKTTNLLLGIIAFCLCGLLVKDTAVTAHAQTQETIGENGHPQIGLPQIAADSAKVYILLDHKMYVYSWDSKFASDRVKALGMIDDAKLNRKEVIDIPAAK